MLFVQLSSAAAEYVFFNYSQPVIFWKSATTTYSYWRLTIFDEVPTCCLLHVNVEDRYTTRTVLKPMAGWL